MGAFFQAQLDYIVFLYGAGFIILAAVCFALRRSERLRLPWGWLAASCGVTLDRISKAYREAIQAC